MAITASSGTTSLTPSLADLALDAFARCQIRSASLTAEHWVQLRYSALMLQSELSNVGMPILPLVESLLITLQAGVTEYTLPASVVAPLDGVLRLYQLGDGQDFDPVITGTAGERIATITQAEHGYAAGDMAFFSTAVAASGQVIQGAYLVQTVVDEDTYQIEVAVPMDGTNSVALPVFNTTAGSSTMRITLANHGLSIGKSFYANVQTTVAGLPISGQLVVTGVVDQNNFTVDLGQSAGSTASVTMNDGDLQVATQAPGVNYVDRYLYPVSRTDYVSQPNKQASMPPTTFWVDRKIDPVLRFWGQPDDNGPYTFRLYYMKQPDDPVVSGGTGIELPFRWWAVYAAGLAKNLARKYPPTGGVGELVAEYKDLLNDALREDIERVPLHISPGFWGYYR